jgi:hypothetical protein
MSATTVPAPTTVDRRARIGAVGGALWALFPVAFGLVALDDTEFGSAAFVAAAASYWLCGVLPPVLLVVGLLALRETLGPAAGKVGRIGLVLAGVGYAAMAIGNGIEVGSMTVGGGEVGLGHGVFLLGFLASIVGGVLLGIVVVRRRDDGLARAAGLVLALALPLGIAVGIAASSIAPGNDASFFAAITVPTGIAWVLLGTALRSGRRPVAEYATAS